MEPVFFEFFFQFCDVPRVAHQLLNHLAKLAMRKNTNAKES
jgi:hypothetical protein